MSNRTQVYVIRFATWRRSRVSFTTIYSVRHCVNACKICRRQRNTLASTECARPNEKRWKWRARERRKNWIVCEWQLWMSCRLPCRCVCMFWNVKTIFFLSPFSFNVMPYFQFSFFHFFGFIFYCDNSQCTSRTAGFWWILSAATHSLVQTTQCTFAVLLRFCIRIAGASAHPSIRNQFGRRMRCKQTRDMRLLFAAPMVRRPCFWARVAPHKLLWCLHHDKHVENNQFRSHCVSFSPHLRAYEPHCWDVYGYGKRMQLCK